MFDHVKDDAIRLDQTERYQQTAICRAHETLTKIKEGKPPLRPRPSGTPSDSKQFIGRDGKEHSYLIAPEDFKKMTQKERETELARLKAARGYNVNQHSANTVVSGNTNPNTAPPGSVPGTPGNMTISYRDAANHGATPSVISNQSGYPTTFSVPPQTGLENPANGTNNLIRQILSANQTGSTAPTPGTSVSQDRFINIDGCVYRQVNTHTVQYDLSRHETSLPLSSLMDGGANGEMTGSNVHVISSSNFHGAHATGIGDATITDLPLITLLALFTNTHSGRNVWVVGE